MDFILVRLFADEAYVNGLLADCPVYLLLILIAVSILVLSKGADWMVDGVVGLAKRTGLPRIVIGATIVSLGTTTPEAFVSVMAAFMGNPGLALGNGVGSIIADTGLIFGLTCMLAVVPMNRFILSRTGWVAGGFGHAAGPPCHRRVGSRPSNPVLGRWVDIPPGPARRIPVRHQNSWAKQGMRVEAEEEDTGGTDGAGQLACLLLTGGLVVVIVGARALIPSASELAIRMRVPQTRAAATMVALGTSLPELMTAIAAIRKGHPEITVGNIVGADVLNCLFVIGASCTARPLEVPSNFYVFHFPTMLFILFSFRYFIHRNVDGHFKKMQGAWLFGIYIAYLILQYGFNVGSAS